MDTSVRARLLDRAFLPESFQDACKLPPEQADFIAPQAFGRNTYFDQEVCGIVRFKRDGLRSDIATFWWLESQSFDPGRPNTFLACRCYTVQMQRQDKIPIIGQWEVMYSLYHEFPIWYEENKENLVAIWPPLEGYLATRGMLIETKKIAKKRDLTNPLLITHPEQIQRSFFIAREIFGKSVSVSHTKGVDREWFSWFDRKSVQDWTRGPKRWFWYEMLVRTHHNLNGWM